MARMVMHPFGPLTRFFVSGDRDPVPLPDLKLDVVGVNLPWSDDGADLDSEGDVGSGQLGTVLAGQVDFPGIAAALRTYSARPANAFLLVLSTGRL